MQTLSVALGLRDRLSKTMSNMFSDMIQKFTNKQAMFRGQRRTYVPEDGFADDPSKRGYTHVESTMEEQLKWFKEHSREYFKNTLSIEKTNSTGIVVELQVGDEVWGKYSTLELLRLKSILDGQMKHFISEMPTRKESQIWTRTSDPNYAGRNVFETELLQGYSKTTLKRTEIVSDPHIKDSPTRPPVTQQIETQVNIGKYTTQDFSGEMSIREKADILVKMEKVYQGVVRALEKANGAKVEESDLGDRFLDFLF